MAYQTLLPFIVFICKFLQRVFKINDFISYFWQFLVVVGIAVGVSYLAEKPGLLWVFSHDLCVRLHDSLGGILVLDIIVATKQDWKLKHNSEQQLGEN